MVDQQQPGNTASAPEAPGERPHQAPAPREGGWRERGGDQRGRRRRKGEGEGFGDQVDRLVCAHATWGLPGAAPVQGRSGIARSRLQVVERTEGTILLCDGVHEGPHEWPGEVSIPPADRVMMDLIKAGQVAAFLDKGDGN